jgi:hypothetical protein
MITTRLWKYDRLSPSNSGSPMLIASLMTVACSNSFFRFFPNDDPRRAAMPWLWASRSADLRLFVGERQ